MAETEHAKEALKTIRKGRESKPHSNLGEFEISGKAMFSKHNIPARKDDSGKLRYTLLPWESLEEVAKVLEMGASKYAPNNWQKVDNAKERYTNAMLRHQAAIQKGEDIDPESGLPHSAHVSCNALFLIWFELREKKND